MKTLALVTASQTPTPAAGIQSPRNPALAKPSGVGVGRTQTQRQVWMDSLLARKENQASNLLLRNEFIQYGKLVFPQTSTTRQFPTCQMPESQSSFPSCFPVPAHPAGSSQAAHPTLTPRSNHCHLASWQVPAFLILVYPTGQDGAHPKKPREYTCVEPQVGSYFSEDIHQRLEGKGYSFIKITCWNPQTCVAPTHSLLRVLISYLEARGASAVGGETEKFLPVPRQGMWLNLDEILPGTEPMAGSFQISLLCTPSPTPPSCEHGWPPFFMMKSS